LTYFTVTLMIFHKRSNTRRKPVERQSNRRQNS